MTRKDYERLARTLAECAPPPALPGMLVETHRRHAEKRQVWAITVQAICNELAADNPRFDRARFLKACGVEA